MNQYCTDYQAVQISLRLYNICYYIIYVDTKKRSLILNLEYSVN